MSLVPTVKLNDGSVMPQLGFGLWQVSDDQAEATTLEAFKAGYRSIDSAAIYGNEAGLGRAIAKSGLKTQDLFITTKLWNTEQGYDKALKAFDESRKKLGVEKVDLYLVHWPSPQRGLFVESWKALVDLQKQGVVKSIGVSNFTVDHLQQIIDATGVVPTLNQIELHPEFQQQELVAFHKKHNIHTECWSPLGQGTTLQNTVIQSIAKKHGKTPAQVIIRWHLQSGFVVIPKSVTPSRIQENFKVFDFNLDGDDLVSVEKLNSANGRIGPDPVKADF